MSKISWRNPFARFLVVGIVLFSLLYFTYELYIKPDGTADEYVITNLVDLTGWGLEVLGYELIPYETEKFANFVGIEGSVGLVVGAPCDGFILFILFLVFVIAYPGPVRHKLWFIPAGMIVIHLINVVRLIALALIVNYSPESLTFHHDYTFTIFVYAFVFLLWYIWVNRFAPKSISHAEKS